MQHQLDSQDINFDLQKKTSIKVTELTSSEHHDDFQISQKPVMNDQPDEIKL